MNMPAPQKKKRRPSAAARVFARGLKVVRDGFAAQAARMAVAWLELWHARLSLVGRLADCHLQAIGAGDRADHARWRVEDVLGSLSHTVAEFGPERCMLVAALATNYDRWVDIVEETTAGSSAGESEAVFAGTARRVYAAS